MNFKKFIFNENGSGSIWVNVQGTLNNLLFLQREIELRINGEEASICILRRESDRVLKGVDTNDPSRFFTFTSSAVGKVIDDGDLHWCIMSDYNTKDTHHLKAGLVVTFPVEEEVEEDYKNEDDDLGIFDNLLDDNRVLKDKIYSSHVISLNSDHPKALFFDTETSGLTCSFNVILQLSYEIVDLSDWTVLKRVNHFFDWPEDQDRVEPDAIDINGLTRNFLKSQILSVKNEALQEFYEDLKVCDCAIAHNLNFDKDFIENESVREKVISDYDEIIWPLCIDTMVDTTNFCHLPPKKNGEYKWPKLIELANILSVDSSGLILHDSSCDTELTKRCFQELCRIGFYHLSFNGESISQNDNFEFITSNVFLMEINMEIDDIMKEIVTDESCLCSFLLPLDNGIGNKVHLDYDIDPRFEECSSVLEYISPEAYSFVKQQKGSYEAKYTFQNMIDLIESEIEDFMPYTNCDPNIIDSKDAIDISISCVAIMQKVISCYETIINKRFPSFYGEPGDPSDLQGLYAVSYYYAKLTSSVFKMHIGLEQMTVPDQYSEKLIGSLESICYNLYYQAKSDPKDSLSKILDIESDPKVRGSIDMAFNISIDSMMLAETLEIIQSYKQALADGSVS